MAISLTQNADEPFSEMNTTPLIDVMLVPEPISASLGAATATDFVQD